MAAPLIVPNALECDTVQGQHLLDAKALLKRAKIHPLTHAASSPLARISNGLPLLSTAIRYATNLRATSSVAWLRSPRCSSRSYTAASSGLWRGANLAALDQDGLQMFVALFGNGPALFFAGGIVLSAGQPAIADRLPDGGEALHFSDFQSPAQCQDLTYGRDTLQPIHPFAQLRMLWEPLQQAPLDISEKLQLSPTQFEQFHHRVRHILQTP